MTTCSTRCTDSINARSRVFAAELFAAAVAGRLIAVVGYISVLTLIRRRIGRLGFRRSTMEAMRKVSERIHERCQCQFQFTLIPRPQEPSASSSGGGSTGMLIKLRMLFLCFLK